MEIDKKELEEILIEQRKWYQNCAARMFKELSDEMDKIFKELKRNQNSEITTWKSAKKI